jgi:MFS family permease
MILLIAFVLWQYITRHTTSTLPARVIFQRSVAFGSISQFCVGATLLTSSIYIPLWFQAIKSTSAIQSGINIIPLVLSLVFGSIISGGLVQRIGYYTPFMIFGSGSMAIGAGLVTTWSMDTTSSIWIGTQIVVGFGIGCTMQHPNIAAQTVLPREDVPIGTAVLSLFQTLGGAIFTAVGQNVYINKFSAGLEQIEGLDPQHVLGSGATNLTAGVTPDIKRMILEAYNDSLTHGTFFAVLIIACLAIPAALGMEWRSTKAKPDTSVRRQDEKPDQQAYKPRSILKTSGTGAGRQEANKVSVTTPAPAWKKTFRQSGRFASYLTATINPDLRDQLGMGKQVRR